MRDATTKEKMVGKEVMGEAARILYQKDIGYAPTTTPSAAVLQVNVKKATDDDQTTTWERLVTIW